MTAIEFTPTEERMVAYCFSAKVRTGRFPDAHDVAEATGIDMTALRYAYRKLRLKGISVAAPAGRRWHKPVADGLTDRQRQIVAFMASYGRTNGFMPTLREISERFGFAHGSACVCHIRALERKGWLRHAGPGKARAYVLAKEVAA